MNKEEKIVLENYIENCAEISKKELTKFMNKWNKYIIESKNDLLLKLDEKETSYAKNYIEQLELEIKKLKQERKSQDINMGTVGEKRLI